MSNDLDNYFLTRAKETRDKANASWNFQAFGWKKYSEEKEKCQKHMYACTEEVSDEEVAAECDNLEFKFVQEKQDSAKETTQTSERKRTNENVPSLYQCAQKLKEEVKIICLENKLYYYDGRCYRALTPDGLISLYREKIDTQLHGVRNMHVFTELYRYLLTDSKIRVTPNWTKLSDLAILNNGIYNVRKGKMKNFSPDIVAFSYVDASFVNEECPKFDNFLYEVTGGDEVLLERLWMTIGYICTQSLDAKAFFVMGQAPNSGKSLLGKFIQNLFEPQYVSSIALSDLNREFSMGSLVGSALNVSLDLPCSKMNPSAVSKLKMLTGGDLITIDEKYVPQFRYQNRAKFLFASNHPIKLAEDDDAFWERMVFLPFDYSVSKERQNEKLLKELLKEKDAVVSKALRYAEKLMKCHYKFPTTKEIEKRIKEWRGITVNTINAFIKNRCIIDDQYRGELVEDLYLQYLGYCAEIGEKAEKQNDFKVYLEKQLGLSHFKMRREKGSNPQSAFRGIQLDAEYL